MSASDVSMGLSALALHNLSRASASASPSPTPSPSASASTEAEAMLLTECTEHLLLLLRQGECLKDPEAEREALDLVKHTCLRTMDTYDTTLEDDEALLDSCERGQLQLPEWHRTCVLVRMGEKRLLRSVLGCLEPPR